MLTEPTKSFTIKKLMNNLLANKLSLAVLLLSLVWVLTDAFSRLIPHDLQASNSNKMVNVVDLSLPQLSAQALSQLALAYQPYKDDKKQNDNKVQGMSAAEQAKQQGLLKSLFIESNKVELKAVIRKQTINSDNVNNRLTALLLITDIKSNKSHIEQFNHNDLVYGYKLSIKTNTQVTLSKQQKQGEQQVILTMYENRKTRTLDPRT